ncbi:MAG: thiol-disulfide isomerase/thioredoxin [Planctomycetota bacterium]|jgi:thiol-disulfide isomerase/thioredoxin
MIIHLACALGALNLTLTHPAMQFPRSSIELERSWRLVLGSPGGELPLRLEFEDLGDELRATLHNGRERIGIREVKREGADLTLRIEPYDSYLFLHVSDDGQQMVGRWEKFISEDRIATLTLEASAGEEPRFPLVALEAEERAKLEGPWAVQFKSDESIAIGHFQAFADGRAEGTFETTLGDYRYLAGSFDGERLRLSCFDGGHAFLFEARLNSDGELVGDFWSRDSWHDTWRAKRDENVKLPDSFALTTWTGSVALKDLVFPDLSNKPRSLADEEFLGKARIITLFGTWCPNCNDEAIFLAELDKRYSERGLSVLGLAFEMDDNFERSKRQIERFNKRHGVQYPVLIAGTADKKVASQAFPALDRVRAFPTAIFIDSKGQVRAIHTGFSGPATGPAHEHMKERYELLIESLLQQ